MKRLCIAVSCFVLVGLVCLSLVEHQALFKPKPIEEVTSTNLEYSSTPNTTSNEPKSTSLVPKRQDSREETPQPAPLGSAHPVSATDNDPVELGAKRVELTNFRGDMKKGKLAQRRWVDISNHPSLPWFTKNASQIAFPESTTSDDRNYFYGWIQLNPNYLHAINRDTFQSHRVEIYEGGSEYRRVKLPRETEELAQLLEHDAVLALGNKPISEKIGPKLQEKISSSIGSETADVFVTLMTTSNLKHWQKEIEELGAVIEHWDPTIRVLVANVPYVKLLDLAERDFVQTVESVGTLELMLDSAVSVSGADGLRTHLGINGSFTGISGENITIGIIDGGLNIAHPDISATRDSICGESFVTTHNGQIDSDDLWFDSVGHGTHITSVFAGAGIDDRNRAGVAPGVKHIRFAKVSDKIGHVSTTASILQAMDYLTEESSCEWNGTESAARKPDVINMSSGGITEDTGYRVTAKKLDWTVWNHNQVYVVSQGNFGTLGYSEFGAAKNSISVGWLTDTLFAHLLSSVGPALDGRMMPTVTMTGDRVLAALGGGAKSGYDLLSGSSMSSALVAGIATLLMSTDDGFKTNPALVRAQLMATAIKADAYFEDENFAPRTNTYGTGHINNTYGLGAVSARTAIAQGPNGEWSSHSSVSEIVDDEYAYIEIEIPADTDRLDIVLTWDEPPNDNVGSAVMADLDLYLGPNEDCDVLECGEYVSSSRVDNLEYLIITNPEPGTKRITVIPHNIFQFAPRVAVSWMYIANSTPQLDIELDADTLYTANTRRPQLDLTVSSDGFVAGGVSLYVACRNQGTGDCDYWFDSDDSRWQPDSRVTREDGTVQSLAGLYIGDPVFIGELVTGEIQSVTLVFPPSMKTRSHQLYVSASSANAFSDVDAVDVIVGNTDLPTLSTAITNDYASTAYELTGDSGTISVDLAAGARQPGELVIDTDVLRTFYRERGWSGTQYSSLKHGYTLSRSAWYKMSTDRAAKYELQITSQVPDAANVSFQLLAVDDMFEPSAGNIWTTDLHEFFLKPDTDYYLRVNTYSTILAPELQITWQKLDAKPVNDDFAERTQLTGESGDVSGNNAFATIERDEPGGYISAGTTWFKWTAPSTGVWTFEADAPYSDESPQVYVFLGESVDELRLVSDPAFFAADVPVLSDQEYQICVSSNAQFTDFQGSYELSWEESSTARLWPNDQFLEAISISGEQGTVARCDRCSGIDRTVEVGEPTDTVSHSLWWEWEAPREDQFTFRIANAQYDKLSIFTGSELSTLTLENSGPELVIDATRETTYYIALHRRSGLEYIVDNSDNSFQWGLTPRYDRISSPLTMTGTTGSTTMELKYATTTPDETRANGLTSTGARSSVWGAWTAPSSFESWMKFSTETWQDAGLQRATDQIYLAIHERDDADTRWNFIASVDRSFIIGGRPEAIFKPESGKEYHIQVALRNNVNTFSDNRFEFDIMWEETGAPSWLISDLDLFEFGSPTGNNITELIDPSAGVVVGRDLDKVLFTLDDETLILQLSEDTGDLSVVETIPYEDSDGEPVEVTDLSIIGWNDKRRTLYVATETGFTVFEGLNQSKRAFSRCDVTQDFSQLPTQVIHEGTGRYVYKIGEGTIASYRVDAPCELELVQVISSSRTEHPLKEQLLELEGLQAVAFGPGQVYLYGFSDENLYTFEKNADTGQLSVVSSTAHSTWLPATGLSGDSDLFDGASVAVDARGHYLFAVGKSNPSIAIFDLVANRESPRIGFTLNNYYIPTNRFFPTHIRRPFRWDFGQCRIHHVHQTENPTIEVFCRYMYFVATYDKETNEFYIADWSSAAQQPWSPNGQPDRFGNRLPVFSDLTDTFSVATPDGQFSYIVVDDWIDSIHRFERVTGANVSIPTPTFEAYDSYLVRLVAMDVESNEISLGSRTFSACETVANLTIDNVTYTVLNSKWQVRNAVGEDWSDVTETVRTDNQLCPYDPTDTRDYRLVFEATIDGVTDKYSSEILVEQPNSN